MRFLFALFLATGLTLGGTPSAHSSSRTPSTNYAAPGNLEPVYEIGCVPSSSLRNSYTPPDLYNGFAKCLAQDEFRKAAFLFMLAGSYTRYDTMRVADKSAHQAVAALRTQAVATIANSRRQAFRDTVKAMASNPADQAALCRETSRIGPPDYYPRYMVQHGLDAFASPAAGSALKDGFDGRAAWKKVLADYLHCPSA